MVSPVRFRPSPLGALVPGRARCGAFWSPIRCGLRDTGGRSNRRLIARGKGHAVVHRSGHHGEFPTRLVVVVAAAAAAFGTTVLILELIGS